MENKNFVIPHKSFLYFEVNNELFAIDTIYAIETLTDQKTTRVPLSSKFVRGIMNFRGDILPVIDLHQMLNFNLSNCNTVNLVVLEVILDSVEQKLGIAVDKVKGVVEMPLSSISPIPEMRSNFNISYFSGMFKLKNEHVMILNPDQIFSLHELTI